MSPDDLRAILAEHRLCGPKYEGCYAHFPMEHCRADGMAWPCDASLFGPALDVVEAARAWHSHPGFAPSQCPICRALAAFDAALSDE